jgi:hypothetical protein
VCLATLAKHSFSLPHSNASYWISQTCKIQESRQVVLPGAIALRASVRSFRRDRSGGGPRVVARNDAPPQALLEFFSTTPLRSPPSFL